MVSALGDFECGVYTADCTGGTASTSWTISSGSGWRDGDTYQFPSVTDWEPTISRKECKRLIRETLEEKEQEMAEERYSLWEVTIVGNETYEIVGDVKLVAKSGTSAKLKAMQMCDLQGDVDDYTIDAIRRCSLPEKKEVMEVRIAKEDA